MGVRYGRFSLKRPLWVFDLIDRFARDRGVNAAARPIGQLTILAIGEFVDGALQRWPHPLRLVLVQNPAGYRLFFGQTKDSQKPHTKRRDCLQISHTYRLRIESEYYQTIEDNYSLAELPDTQNPNNPYPQLQSIDLEPGYAYPFPRLSNNEPTLLRGHVHASDGTGIADVHISIAGEGFDYKTTDKTGQWVLVLPVEMAGIVSVFFIYAGIIVQSESVEIEPGKANKLPPIMLDV